MIAAKAARGSTGPEPGVGDQMYDGGGKCKRDRRRMRATTRGVKSLRIWAKSPVVAAMARSRPPTMIEVLMAASGKSLARDHTDDKHSGRSGHQWQAMAQQDLASHCYRDEKSGLLHEEDLWCRPIRLYLTYDPADDDDDGDDDGHPLEAEEKKLRKGRPFVYRGSRRPLHRHKPAEPPPQCSLRSYHRLASPPPQASLSEPPPQMKSLEACRGPYL